MVSEANKIVFPEICYGLNIEGKDDEGYYGKLICIKWGEKGYYRTDYTDNYRKEDVNLFNERLGVSPKEAEAMKICSMCDKLTPKKWEKHYTMVLTTMDEHARTE